MGGNLYPKRNYFVDQYRATHPLLIKYLQEEGPDGLMVNELLAELSDLWEAISGDSEAADYLLLNHGFDA